MSSIIWCMIQIRNLSMRFRSGSRDLSFWRTSRSRSRQAVPAVMGHRAAKSTLLGLWPVLTPDGGRDPHPRCRHHPLARR